MHKTYDTLFYTLCAAENNLSIRRINLPLTYVKLLAYLYKQDREMETVTARELKASLNYDNNDLYRAMAVLAPLYIEIQTIRVNWSKKSVQRYTLSPTGTLYIQSLLAIMEGA